MSAGMKLIEKYRDIDSIYSESRRYLMNRIYCSDDLVSLGVKNVLSDLLDIIYGGGKQTINMGQLDVFELKRCIPHCMIDVKTLKSGVVECYTRK